MQEQHSGKRGRNMAYNLNITEHARVVGVVRINVDDRVYQ